MTPAMTSQTPAIYIVRRDNHFLTRCLAIAGRSGAAIEAAERAMQQSPNDPWFPHWLRAVARAHFSAGRYEEAVRFAEQSIGYNYQDLWNCQAATKEVLAASYSQLGRLAEARAAFAETSELAPHRTSAWVSLFYAIAEPEHRERYVTALRRVGLED